MKLDSRIILKRGHELEIFGNDTSIYNFKNYWKTKGYCADKIEDYQNLDNTVVGKLLSTVYNPHKAPHLYGVGIKAIKKIFDI